MSIIKRALGNQQAGLVLVIVGLGVLLALTAGSHVDQQTGRVVNNFYNLHTLLQTATDASFFAIMAVGATVVIISGGIDLSVGSIYALAGVAAAMVLRSSAPESGVSVVLIAIAVSMAVGLVCGVLNGVMVVGLRVHPFIITLGTMWIVRGVAFVASHAESILVPPALTAVAKASLGMAESVYPVPLLIMLGYGERRATATSLCAIVIIAVAGAGAQALYGNVDAGDAALLAVPAMIGVGLGVALQQRLPERTISLLFSLLLVAIAIELVVP